MEELRMSILNTVGTRETEFQCFQATHVLRMELQATVTDTGEHSNKVQVSGTFGAVLAAIEHIKASLGSWVGDLVEVPARGCPRSSGLTELLTQVDQRYNVGVHVATVAEEMGEAWQDAVEANVSTAVKVTISGCAQSEVSSARAEACRIAMEKLCPRTGDLRWRDRQGS